MVIAMVDQYALKLWRASLGWTQKKAAQYLVVPLTTYERWEAGTRKVHNPGPVKKLMTMAYRGWEKRE